MSSTLPGTSDVIRAVNPATKESVGEYSLLTDQQLRERMRKADAAFSSWKNTAVEDRCRYAARLGDSLRQRTAELGKLMTREMGKPISQARSEVEKCAWVCDFYAENASTFLRPKEIETDASRSLIRFDPLGPILAVMPWNFPFWQVFRCAVPGLLAGNVFLLKHAKNVPGCGEMIERLFEDAGFPTGTFTNLLIRTSQTQLVIKDNAVRGVTLTGSGAAGAAVAKIAGEVIKKCVLELGGSDPFIVLKDANIDHAAEKAVQGRTQNTGQSCIAAKRFIVERPVIEAFTQAMVARMKDLEVGDPMDPDTDIGPLAREDLLDDLHDQVQRSVDAGAQLLCGGERLDRPGYFYLPTVLGNVEPGMAAFDEETFGPVAAIIEAQDPDHAVQLANHSEFGLGSSLWTNDSEQALRLATRIEAGNVFINEIVKSDPRLPFGGIKSSGFGRELSEIGMHEFVNIKTVWLN